MCVLLFFFFKQKTAYGMRISDWSSDVFSSDVEPSQDLVHAVGGRRRRMLDINVERLKIPAIIITHQHGRMHARGQGPPERLASRPAAARRNADFEARPVQPLQFGGPSGRDRKSTRLNSSHYCAARMPSS